jgi:hypothetical protein
VDEADYNVLSENAEANGRSVSEELRLAIAERARKIRTEKMIGELRQIRALTKGKLGPYPDSVALVRAVRDEE